MLGRKSWAETPLVELSAKKRLAESSTSFRRGVLWFVRRGLFFRLFGFSAFWFRLLLPFFWFLFLLFFFFEAVVFGVNDLDVVPAKGEQFRSGFEMFGSHISLVLRIRPLECGRHQLHEGVHEHSPTFLGIK